MPGGNLPVCLSCGEFLLETVKVTEAGTSNKLLLVHSHRRQKPDVVFVGFLTFENIHVKLIR